jgi:hypothetical protein
MKRPPTDIVKKDEAQRAILAEWDRWKPLSPDDAKVMNGMMSFVFLQRERRSLLDFPSNRDKWQEVHGWLRRAGRVEY